MSWRVRSIRPSPLTACQQSGPQKQPAIGQGRDRGIAVGKADLGHKHGLVDITDAGALAGKTTIASTDIDDNAVTSAKIADAAITESKLAAAAITQSKIAADAVGATQLQDGIPISMRGALLSGAELIDYSETSPAPVVSAGTLTLDLDTDVFLTENVTSLILAKAPAAGRAGSATLILKQDVIGGRTLAWPGSVLWAGGTPPLVTPTADAVDIYASITRDGGRRDLVFPADGTSADAGRPTGLAARCSMRTNAADGNLALAPRQ